MPKSNDINSVLIIGSGPIVIGQACEFDYSGVQACRSLKEEGIKVILLNSNPATIMTDPEIADKTYIEPICYEIIEKIIKIENPDAILPTMGGQIALNCILDLEKNKILDKTETKIIGISIESINKAENRNLFQKSMKKIGLQTARYGIANKLEEAMLVLKKIGLPCIIRSSFVMGGENSNIAYTNQEFIKICNKHFHVFPNNQIYIDEFLNGWKEYEMEAIRDKNGNCIIICSAENIDPTGIHTGDSITVMPAQTLTDKEYQIMRSSTISILKEIGINQGGSNVQFAVNPKNGKMLIIEMNPRVSRSSALASKATGFPIAKISAKLAIGYTLDELCNDISKNKIPASFEPSIDYIVTKMPRFDFQKFKGSKDNLGTSMKSVGEVMAIGRTQQESLQKALRSLEINVDGLVSKIENNSKRYINIIRCKLKQASSERIFYIADAFRLGMSIKTIYQLTKIDKWFLRQIEDLVYLESKIIKNGLISLNNSKYLKYLKCKGFADSRIAYLLGVPESEIRNLRIQKNIYPVYKRVDTCAAEFTTDIAYMYSTYEDECESNPSKKQKKILVLGSGPNRIGQGIEFDYCCVQAILTLKDSGYETIMINCNPETVSTDYDISDRLYFEPITMEHVLDIIRIEKPTGVIVQYGGETPLKLAIKLELAGVKLLGTSSKYIDKSEDRIKFKKIIKDLKLEYPKHALVNSLKSAINKAKVIGYPLIIRPSYVLGGKSIKILYNKKDLENYFSQLKISKVSNFLIEKFIKEAVEVETDIVCDGNNVLFGSIIENIEESGIHSGDSTCCIPTYTLNDKIKKEIKRQSKKIAFELKVIGLMNIQFLIKESKIFVMEVNPRASRTIPFTSKAIGLPLTKIATKVIIGKSLKEQNLLKEIHPKYYSIKKSIFPFSRFLNFDPILGPEMHSTGETMSIGRNFEEAVMKSMLHTKLYRTCKRILIYIACKEREEKILILAKILKGFSAQYDTDNKTSHVFHQNGINTRVVKKKDLKFIKDKIKNKKYDYIIVIDNNNSSTNLNFAKKIRLEAIKYKINFDTTINSSIFTAKFLLSKKNSYNILSIQEIHKNS